MHSNFQSSHLLTRVVAGQILFSCEYPYCHFALQSILSHNFVALHLCLLDISSSCHYNLRHFLAMDFASLSNAYRGIAMTWIA